MSNLDTPRNAGENLQTPFGNLHSLKQFQSPLTDYAGGGFSSAQNLIAPPTSKSKL